MEQENPIDVLDNTQIDKSDVDFFKQGMSDHMAQNPVVETQPVQEQPVANPTEQPIVQTDTPASEPVAAVPTSQEPDYIGWMKNKFGLENEDALTAALNKAKQYETIETELNTLKSQPPTETFKTDFGRVADELTSKGVHPSTIARFYGLELDKMSAEDVINLKLEVDHPKLNAEQREAFISETYGSTDELLTEGQKAAREVKKEQDAAIARESLTNFISKTFSPQEQKPVIDPAVARKEQERSSYWKDAINRIDESSFSINRNGKMKIQGVKGLEEIDHNFAFSLPQEAKQEIISELKDMIANPAFAEAFGAGEQGLINANEYVKNRTFAKHGEEILSRALQYAAERESKLHEKYAMLLHNPQQRGVPANVSTRQNGQEAWNDAAVDALNKV